MSACDKYLASVKARAAAATPGPWKNDLFPAAFPFVIYPNGYVAFQPGSKYTRSDDAQFVAHARTDVDRLVAMVEAALFTAREVENACDDIADTGAPGFRTLADQMVDLRRELDRIAGEGAP